VLNKWKNHLLEKGAESFSDKAVKSKETPIDLDSLHATIGKLKVENDFLLKAYAKLK
jgi:transposase